MDVLREDMKLVCEKRMQRVEFDGDRWFAAVALEGNRQKEKKFLMVIKILFVN